MPTKSQYLQAIIENDFNHAKAGRALGVSREAVSQYLFRHADLRAKVEEAKNALDDVLKDAALGNVAKAILDGDLKMTRWWLERKDPAFRASMGVRLDEGAIGAFVDQVAQVGGKDALRKLAEGG